MSAFPKPRDREAARRLREAFPLPQTAGVREVLDCLGGNSPYLADLALRAPETLVAICTDGPDAVCDRALGRLSAAKPTESREKVTSLMRGIKREVALAAAIADIGGAWNLAQVTGTLSDLADGALRLSVSHLLRAAHDKGDLRLANPSAPAQGSGFAVLAMGKLGARALNFSSDVDLVLIYDSAVHPYSEAGVGATFARLARDLVSLMQQRDANGYVFRTDLRLRPDPGSTPLAVSLATALSYYEASAQTWERAAMIKARPVAGDLVLGRRFLEAIRPFIWRRHLDFAAIADIRAMKQRMDGQVDAALATKGTAEARLLGHDLKLGEGGIREIEFCAQTLQLVWGGRSPSLRVAPTLPALEAVAAAGHLPQPVAKKLADAYVFLRGAEHRLQMVADRQTHSLPGTPEGLEDFAGFFGFRDSAAFATKALRHLKLVHRAFKGLLEKPADPPDLVPAEAQQAPAAPAATGPAPPWAAWLAGRPRALRTERARTLLQELLPSLSAAVAQQPHPDLVWNRLDELIYRLPAGVQIFSMLRHNPALLDRLATVLGAAPSLADHLASVPAALEGLFSPQNIDHLPGASLAAQLTDAQALDQALAIATRFIRGEEFRLAVAELDGRIDQDEAGLARTQLADAAISQLLPLVMAEQVRRYGTLRGGGLVVVALGKAGSSEMMAGSDLDLMLVYDHPENAESSGHARLPPSQYFARAAQAIVAALTVPTRDGKLYEVDMRLRPSGSKGPVAVSLAALERYHRESAWTWERLALTRARVVAGPKTLSARVARALHRAVAEGAHNAIAADTLAMRKRLWAELPPQGHWDIKLRRGGLLDVEFVAQALQLLRANERNISNPTTRIALRNLAQAGMLAADEADMLIQADRVWRACQGLLRICEGRSVPKALAAPVETRLVLLLDRLLGEQPDRNLGERLQSVADNVNAAFVRHIGVF